MVCFILVQSKTHYRCNAVICTTYSLVQHHLDLLAHYSETLRAVLVETIEDAIFMCKKTDQS